MVIGFDAGVGFDYALVGFDGADLAQFTIADLCVQLFLKSPPLITKVTSSVMVEDGVQIARGRQGEANSSTPSSCRLTLLNNDGKYSPRYSAGSLYGRLGRNTPIRVGLGKPIIGRTTTGSGATLDMLQVAESNGYGAVAVLAVYHIGVVTNLTTPTSYTGAVEVDTASFTYERSHFTDADVVPNVTSTASNTGPWATAHVAIPSGTLSGSTSADAQDGSSCFVDISDGAGKTYVAVAYWSQDPYGRMGAPKFTGQIPPVEMYLVEDSGPSTGPRVAIWAWKAEAGQAGEVNLEGAHDGATDIALTVASYTDVAPYTPRFTGEIADWPQVWDKTGSYWTTPITAGGALRRATASQDITSPLRAAFTYPSGLTNYWPLEDPAGSLTFAPRVGTGVMVGGGLVDPLVVPSTRAVPVAAAGSDLAGAEPIPDFTGAWIKAPVAGTNTTSWGVGAFASFGTTDDLFPIIGVGTSGTLGWATAAVFSTTNAANTFIYSSGGGTGGGTGSLAAAFPNGVLGRQAYVYFTFTQNGAAADWSMKVTNVTPGDSGASVTISGSQASTTIGALREVNVGYYAPLGLPATNTHYIGHVFATSGTTVVDESNKASAARGWDGLLLTDTFERVARDAGFQTNIVTEDTFDLLKAGPVAAQPVAQNLTALEAAGQALLNDSAGFVGMDWRPFSHSVSQASVFTLDYTAGTFTGPLGPVDDDALTVNEAAVTARQGTAVSSVTSGAYGSQPGGVGKYATTATLPVWRLSNAADVAGWLTNVGTLDAARWPELTLEMTAAGNAALDLPTLSIGDVVTVTNLPAKSGQSTVSVQVVGFQEDIGAALYRLTLNCRLADAWRVLIWDDSTYGVWANSASPTNTDARWGL